MGKETRILHISVANGKPEDVKAVRDAIQVLKGKLDFDVEFLVTNEMIELRDVRTMISELYELYNQTKETK